MKLPPLRKRNEWEDYRVKVKYFVPLTQVLGGYLAYIAFTNFDFGSDLGDSQYRTSNSIASSHILALNYDGNPPIFSGGNK